MSSNALAIKPAWCRVPKPAQYAHWLTASELGQQIGIGRRAVSIRRARGTYVEGEHCVRVKANGGHGYAWLYDPDVDAESAAARARLARYAAAERRQQEHQHLYASQRQRLTPEEIAEGVELASDEGLQRALLRKPKTRGECVDGPRPCPWASCRHHLFLEVKRDAVNTLRAFDDLHDMSETCALDVADRKPSEGLRHGATLEDVGDALGMTRERVRQIEAKALGKLGALLEEGDLAGGAVDMARARGAA